MTMPTRREELFGIRRGEGALVGLFFLYFMVLETAHYVGKSVRQATFIDFLGADKLPWVYLALALSSLPVLVLYSRFTERVEHSRLVVVSCAALAALMVVFYGLFGLGTAWVSALFYVVMTVAFGIAISQLWTLAHDVFDARQARRLFAVITAGGLFGGIPGGQLARLVAGRFGTRAALLAAAALLLLTAVVVMVIVARTAPRRREQVSARDLEAARGGLQALRGSRLLMLIAALMLTSVVVGEMVDLQFFWMLEKSTSSLDQRTAVVGHFFSAMGLLAFVFQVAFTGRIHRGLGVEGGLRVLPGAVGVTGIAFAVSLGVSAPLAVTMAWVLKLAETGLRHSVDQSTRELLFQPVSEKIRRRAKAFVDVFVQRAATGVAALILLPVTFGVATATHLSWATVALCVVWLALIRAVQQEYVRAFRRGLASGVLQEPAAIDPGDITTVTTLVQSLGSSRPREVLHGLDLLAGSGYGNLVPPLLLHHPDPEVRRRTLEVLGASGRCEAAPLVAQAVGDDDPRVRTGAIETLAILEGRRASGLLEERLDDPDPGARAAAAAALLTASRPAAAERGLATLVAMAADPAAAVRAEVAAALAAVAEPAGCATLVQLLFDHELEVVRGAVQAVRRRVERDGHSPIYVPILISLMGNRRLKHDAREALVACGEGAIAALALFMESPDEQIWVRRAVPKTIALTATQPAADVLVAALGEGDAILRSKIIEALLSLRASRPELVFPPQVVRRQIRVEVQRSLAALVDLWAVAAPGTVVLDGPFAEVRPASGRATLLQELLALELRRSLSRVLGLLGLLSPLEDMRATWRSLAGTSPQLRARALEYLDNTLRGRLKADVLSVVDDAPLPARLSRALALLGRQKPSAAETVRRLLHADLKLDPAGVALAMAAIHAVRAAGLSELEPELRALSTATQEPLLAETARWALGLETGETPMTTMARIEIVMLLQRVDLFAACTADQIVQLAAIASERSCDQGEVIYRRGEPADALFCVVSGRVALRAPERTDCEVGADGRFGVVDILSGRPRPCDAVALAPDTRLITVQAEDFFDLLANNIEIVKALFRQVVSE